MGRVIYFLQHITLVPIIMINVSQYKTKDLGEASALICKSAKLLRLERENKFFWFIFQDANLCESFANEYWYGELKVIAREYYEAMRLLKDRIFQESEKIFLGRLAMKNQVAKNGETVGNVSH